MYGLNIIIDLIFYFIFVHFIGKTVKSAGGFKRDVSILAKLNTKGVVRQSFVTTNEDGYRTHKVVVHETRIPKIGDKFASRHGQKGVVGMIYRQEVIDTCINEKSSIN